MISADSAVVDYYVPGPEGDGVPLERELGSRYTLSHEQLVISLLTNLLDLESLLPSRQLRVTLGAWAALPLLLRS